MEGKQEVREVIDVPSRTPSFAKQTSRPDTGASDTEDRSSYVGYAAYNSDEFRAFAIRWLGFDPRDVEVMSCIVTLPYKGLCRYVIERPAKAKREDVRNDGR